MKKLLFTLLIFLNCEFQTSETFNLIYSVTSILDETVPIEITYKVGTEYVTEQTQTPFIFEQNIELNESKNKNYQYYLNVLSICKNNLNIKIISNDEIKQNINNLINPIIISGYIGFGLTSVNINL